jgi:hypothetical protein
MNQIPHELAERIRGEANDLEFIQHRIGIAWQSLQKSPNERGFLLDSVALNLHSFYSGLERIFELIARNIDRAIPNSQTWHRDLLLLMGQEVADVRPALIQLEEANQLDEFRRFRHLVRNVYTFNLQPEKMAGLVEALPDLWPNLRSELLAFADFLDYPDTPKESGEK